MNKDIILGLTRHVLTSLGSLLVAKGISDTTGVEAAAGALVTLIGFTWSALSKRPNAE